MAYDMLINLYELNELEILKEEQALKEDNILLRRALYLDKEKVLNFVNEHFPFWTSECEIALIKNTCFVAVKDKEVVGIACFEATAKGYFGPIGIREDQRGNKLGTMLTNKCLLAMKDDNYGYAIVGSVGGALDFYKKTFQAKIISDTSCSVYTRTI